MAQSYPRFPQNITHLMTLRRAEGTKIIHIHASFEPDKSDWMPKYKLGDRMPCVVGTPGIETVPFAVE